MHKETDNVGVRRYQDAGSYLAVSGSLLHYDSWGPGDGSHQNWCSTISRCSSDDTDGILTGLGYNEQKIGELWEQGVIISQSLNVKEVNYGKGFCSD